MAKKTWIYKATLPPKFSSRTIHRCGVCGRRHGYIRDFGLCRLCFREMAHNAEIPGVKKASW